MTGVGVLIDNPFGVAQDKLSVFYLKRVADFFVRSGFSVNWFVLSVL